MNLINLNKLINSELTSKIIKSDVQFDEILINVSIENLYSTLLFLKTDENCKFKQLIDVVGVDYPNSETRFKIYYLLLSHEFNLRVKVFTSCPSLKLPMGPTNFLKPGIHLKGKGTYSPKGTRIRFAYQLFSKPVSGRISEIVL